MILEIDQFVTVVNATNISKVSFARTYQGFV